LSTPFGAILENFELEQLEGVTVNSDPKILHTNFVGSLWIN